MSLQAFTMCEAEMPNISRSSIGGPKDKENNDREAERKVVKSYQHLFKRMTRKDFIMLFIYSYLTFDHSNFAKHFVGV